MKAGRNLWEEMVKRLVKMFNTQYMIIHSGLRVCHGGLKAKLSIFVLIEGNFVLLDSISMEFEGVVCATATIDLLSQLIKTLSSKKLGPSYYEASPLTLSACHEFLFSR